MLKGTKKLTASITTCFVRQVQRGRARGRGRVIVEQILNGEKRQQKRVMCVGISRNPFFPFFYYAV